MASRFRPIARACAAVLVVALAAAGSTGLVTGLALAQTDPPADTPPPDATAPPETTPITEPQLPPETPPSTTPDPPTPSTTEPATESPTTTPSTTPEPTTSTSQPEAAPETRGEPRDTEIFIGSVSTLSGAQRAAVEAFLAATGELARARSALAASGANLDALSAQLDAADARAQVAAVRVAVSDAAFTVTRASLINLALDPAARGGFGRVVLTARVVENPRLRVGAQREEATAERVVARAVADRAAALADVDRAQSAVDAAEDDLRRAALALAAVANGDPMITALLTGRPPAGDSIAATIAAAQTGQGNPATLTGLLDLPTPSAPLVSRYGYRIDPITGDVGFHPGIDLSARQGTPILAAAAGRVLVAREEGGYGNAVVLDHGDSVATLYGHMVSVAVEPGQQVAAGEVIGYVGSTGRSTGPHLHFEVRIHGVAVDPLPVLVG